MWFLLAFSSAIFDSLKDFFSKKSFVHADEYVIGWAMRCFSIPLLLIVLWWLPSPHLENRFWPALIVSGSLNVIATVCYVKAIKHSDLSKVAPMATFSPLFLLLFSPLIVGEFPPLLGLTGVLFIVGGSYLLNIKERHGGYLMPFKALVRERGPKYMLLTAFLWSITASFDKIGVQSSSPVVWVTGVTIFLSVGLSFFLWHKSSAISIQMRKGVYTLIGLAVMNVLANVAKMTALSLTLVVYVSAINRLGVLISVFYGHYFFKEVGVKERLAGAFVMVLGSILIVFSL